MGRLSERGPQADASSHSSEEWARNWCWTQNQWAHRVGLDRWYFVAPAKDGAAQQTIAKDGLDSELVWKMLHGWRPDFHGWTADRLAVEERRIRFLARMGMPQDVFEQTNAVPHRRAA